MKVWLDDLRDPAKHGRIGWTWVTTAQAAIDLLATGEVEEISLDHDLALEHMPFMDTAPADYKEQTGYSVVCWMEKHNVWPAHVYVHSMNPVGRARMLAAINRHYEK